MRSKRLGHELTVLLNNTGNNFRSCCGEVEETPHEPAISRFIGMELKAFSTKLG